MDTFLFLLDVVLNNRMLKMTIPYIWPFPYRKFQVLWTLGLVTFWKIIWVNQFVKWEENYLEHLNLFELIEQESNRYIIGEFYISSFSPLFHTCPVSTPFFFTEIVLASHQSTSVCWALIIYSSLHSNSSSLSCKFHNHSQGILQELI